MYAFLLGIVDTDINNSKICNAVHLQAIFETSGVGSLQSGIAELAETLIAAIARKHALINIETTKDFIVQTTNKFSLVLYQTNFFQMILHYRLYTYA